MPLDPLAKRFLVMMAAAASSDRSRPTPDDRRQALAKLMQFARADVTAEVGVDGVLPGPAGDIPYRLYAPANTTTEHLPGFVFFHGGGMVAGSIDTHDRLCACARTSDRLPPVIGWLPPRPRAQISSRRRRRDRRNRVGIPAGCIARHRCDKASGGRRFRRSNACAQWFARTRCEAAGRRSLLQCLICPVLDFGETSPSRRAFARKLSPRQSHARSGPRRLSARWRRSCRSQHITASRRRSGRAFRPRLSIPPNLTRCATKAMPMQENSRRPALRVDHICHAGMTHNFHAMGAILPQGRAGAQADRRTGQAKRWPRAGISIRSRSLQLSCAASSGTYAPPSRIPEE